MPECFVLQGTLILSRTSMSSQMPIYQCSFLSKPYYTDCVGMASPLYVFLCDLGLYYSSWTLFHNGYNDMPPPVLVFRCFTSVLLYHKSVQTGYIDIGSH